LKDIIDSLLEMCPKASLASCPDGFWLEVPDDCDVVEMARRLAAREAHLSTVTASALPDGETRLIYHYRLGSAALNLKVSTRGNAIASITPVNRAASWIEREIQDLYAVTFTGHPNPARLIRPPELPAGFFRQPGGKAAGQKS
jgi:NADH-quinone oxidoreductase subunit C